MDKATLKQVLILSAISIAGCWLGEHVWAGFYWLLGAYLTFMVVLVTTMLLFVKAIINHPAVRFVMHEAAEKKA